MYSSTYSTAYRMNSLRVLDAETGKVEGVHFTYKWVIDDFCLCYCKSVGERIESPTFTTSSSDNTQQKWRLRLYPKGDRLEFRDYISIFLMSLNEPDVEVRYSLYIFDSNEHKVATTTMGQTTVFRSCGSWGSSRFLKRSTIIDEVTEVLISGSLTVYCDITVDPESTNMIKRNSRNEIKELEFRRLKELDDLETLMESEKYSDVSISVDDRIFHAHKNILTSKSVVFAKMFDASPKENEEKPLVIEGVNADVFCELLRYVYAGKVNDVEKHVGGLLAEANKYKIQGLKVMCEDVLHQCLTVDNAMEYLKLAHLHECEELKKKIIDFIVINARKMLDAPGYKSIGEVMPPNIVYEIIRNLTLQEYIDY